MVVLGLGECVDARVIENAAVTVTHVVVDHVRHHPDVLFVARLYELFEFLLGAEEWVCLVEVREPVAVVRVRGVLCLLWSRRDPYRVVAQVLDII